MAQINPHINFNGNAEEAFNFYKSVFGGEFAKIMRFKDMASPEFEVSESEANKIMLPLVQASSLELLLLTVPLVQASSLELLLLILIAQFQCLLMNGSSEDA